MLKSTFPVLVYFLLAVCFPGILAGQETLRYRLEKGDLFTVEQQAEQQIIQKIDQSEHRVTNRISALLQFRVVGKRDSSYLNWTKATCSRACSTACSTVPYAWSSAPRAKSSG